MTEHPKAPGSDSQQDPWSLFGEPDLGLRIRPAAFARMVGVTRQTVSRWIKEGKVLLDSTGRLDPRKAAERVMAYSDPSRLRAKVLRAHVDDVATLRHQARSAEARADHAAARADQAERELDATEAALDRLLELVFERRAEIAALEPGEGADEWLQDLYGRALTETGYGSPRPAGAGDEFGDNPAPQVSVRAGPTT